jgi:hypothetical protein
MIEWKGERAMRERNRDERETPAGGGAAVPAAGDLGEQAERLFAAGGDAIERALSQDSAAFLAANQQEGGQ